MYKESGRDAGDEEAARRKEEAEGAKGADDEALAKRVEQARSHPVRAVILALLSRHTGLDDGLTTLEVGEHLPDFEDGPRSFAAIAYHLRVLAGVGLVRARDNPDAPDGRLEKVWALP